MYTYKIVTFTNLLGTSRMILRSDGTYIPFDPDNTQYQEYLVWVADGNVAEEVQG